MAYRMTPARRAALRKAQAASARKRRKGPRRPKTKVGKAFRKSRVGASLHRSRLRHRAAMRNINTRRAKQGQKAVGKGTIAKGAGKVVAGVAIHQGLRHAHPAAALAYSSFDAARGINKHFVQPARKKKRKR
jgi:hypothetical protein